MQKEKPGLKSESQSSNHSTLQRLKIMQLKDAAYDGTMDTSYRYEYLIRARGQSSSPDRRIDGPQATAAA